MEDANVEVLKVCGNCYHFDIIMDKGGVCTCGGGETPCDRDGKCDDWAFLNI